MIYDLIQNFRDFYNNVYFQLLKQSFHTDIKKKKLLSAFFA